MDRVYVCLLHVSTVGFFTIRQKRIRGGSTYAECNSGLRDPPHCLTATPGYTRRHTRLRSAAGQTPLTLYIQLYGGGRQTCRDGGTEGARQDGESEGGREEGREGGREEGREGGREGGKEVEREGGREGARGE